MKHLLGSEWPVIDLATLVPITSLFYFLTISTVMSLLMRADLPLNVESPSLLQEWLISFMFQKVPRYSELFPWHIAYSLLHGNWMFIFRREDDEDDSEDSEDWELKTELAFVWLNLFPRNCLLLVTYTDRPHSWYCSKLDQPNSRIEFLALNWITLNRIMHFIGQCINARLWIRDLFSQYMYVHMYVLACEFLAGCSSHEELG